MLEQLSADNFRTFDYPVAVDRAIQPSYSTLSGSYKYLRKVIGVSFARENRLELQSERKYLHTSITVVCCVILYFCRSSEKFTDKKQFILG